MAENQIDQYAMSVAALLADDARLRKLSDACLADAGKYTLQDMSAKFSQGILTILEDRPSGHGEIATSEDETRHTHFPLPNPLPQAGEGANEPLREFYVNRQAANADGRLHIAIIWQRFLPYHIARIRHLNEKCIVAGYRLTAIEVASQDDSYSFKEVAQAGNDKLDKLCCFPGSSYHAHTATEIHQGVSAWLMRVNPDVILAPATPFPEGMAAVQYRTRFGIKNVMMDDAWEHTDRNLKSWPVRWVKRQLHKCIDAVFVPAESHRPYFENLGFAKERIIYGVDVVDNQYFFDRAEEARKTEEALRARLELPEKYFLYVGRFLKRKGIETLLSAYRKYREACPSSPWSLVLVGSGSYIEEITRQGNLIDGVVFAGEQHGDDLCVYYGLARFLVVPSEIDPWGLVVNEGMASGLPVIVSRGCGSAQTLVREGENGWTFAPNDDEALMRLMLQAGGLSDVEHKMMGAKSLEIIADWSLERFAQGVLDAIQVTPRQSIPVISRILSRVWKGRVSIN